MGDAAAQAVLLLREEADEPGRHLGVRMRAEGHAHVDELDAQLVKVHQRAVMRQRDDNVVDGREVRLRALPPLAARGAIAHMADSHLAGQGREIGVREDLRHKAEILAHHHRGAVAHGDASAFLAAMLQRVQAKVGHAGHVAPRCPDAKDAALVVEVVVPLAEFAGLNVNHAAPSVCNPYDSLA